jgi:hypothetical protein
MKRHCPSCLKELPDADLPVCAHCGAPLPHGGRQLPAAPSGPPVTGTETAEQLVERFFEPPLVYTVPRLHYLLYLVAPLLLPVGPLVLPPPEKYRWMLALAVGVALSLSVTLGLCFRPARVAVVLDRHGLRHQRRSFSWLAVTGTRLIKDHPKRREPRYLDILVEPASPLRLDSRLTATAAIGSLRNLAEIIDILVATRVREQTAAHEAGDNS